MLEKIRNIIAFLIFVRISLLLERHGFGEQKQTFFYIIVGINILYEIKEWLVILTDHITEDEMTEKLANVAEGFASDLFFAGQEIVVMLVLAKLLNVDFFILFELIIGYQVLVYR